MKSYKGTTVNILDLSARDVSGQFHVLADLTLGKDWCTH